MLHLLLAVAVTGTVFAAIPPAEAKSIWLECTRPDIKYVQAINLDSAKERFSLTFKDIIYQGPAMFSPGQINFEYQMRPTSKRAYSVNRKSLEFTENMLLNWLGNGWEGLPPNAGKCSIMKTPPTAGNQI
jgi:hypothetical protein